MKIEVKFLYGVTNNSESDVRLEANECTTLTVFSSVNVANIQQNR